MPEYDIIIDEEGSFDELDYLSEMLAGSDEINLACDVSQEDCVW